MSHVRSLDALARSASTSRVLNLHLVHADSGETDDYRAAPFFEDPVLNRSILVKHKLRQDEIYLLPGTEPVVTKIIFPLDRTDLKTGGQSILVGQTGYKQALCDVLGTTQEELEPDLAILDLLNQLPSLDPFLVREQLRRNARTPADCYFAITPADTARMLDFASSEISDLISLAFAGGNGKEVNPDLVKRLADALLSTKADTRLDPLRLTLGLEGEQFKAGVFSWKGFIYYKWQFSGTVGQISRVATELDAVKLAGRVDRGRKLEIEDMKASIRSRVRQAARDAKGVLTLYDDAFADLVKRGNAAAFRKFLLDAPTLFVELGHGMGVISHIASYWGFKFKSSETKMDVDEFIEILREFSTGLAPERKTQVTWG
jgi:hypothetical protein